MNRKIGIATVLLLGLMQSDPASGEKYTCTAAREIAKLGVHRDNEVGIEEDTGRRECRFSVNGATTDSPPIAEVLSGLNAIIVGQVIQQLSNGNVSPLAHLLLAPSRDSSPPDELVSALRGSAQNLTDCFNALRNGNVGFSTEGTRMRCRVAAPGGDSRQFGGILAETTVPHLQLLVSMNSRNLYLFVPVNYRGGRPLVIP